MNEHESAFWRWSHQRYAAKGVSTILLKLQDEFALNVNLVLWCIWCAEHYAQAPELVIRKAHDLTARWSAEVAAPLRQARRQLKSPPSQADEKLARALRKKVKKAELDAEEIEQAMLERLARETLNPATGADVETTARRNLAHYAALAGAAEHEGFTISLLEDAITAILTAPSIATTLSDNG